VTRIWPDDPKPRPVPADIEPVWVREHKRASGQLPLWQRLAAWLGRANRRSCTASPEAEPEG
jgi:hypothetical protein